MNTDQASPSYIRRETLKALPPPPLVSGPLAWIREHLFSSIPNTILTFLAIYLIYVIVPPILRFFFIDAVWTGTNGDVCRAQIVGHPVGACWAYVIDKINFFVYGFYPIDQRWRVNITFALFFVTLAGVAWTEATRPFLKSVLVFQLLVLLWIVFGRPSAAISSTFTLFLLVGAALASAYLSHLEPKRAVLISALTVFPFLSYILLVGRPELGLDIVPTSSWGGILVTLVVATVGIVFSLPLGIVLALGRRSKLPLTRLISIIFIEFVRGVPLITVLFMANTMLPLFLPEGVSIDRLLRPLVGVSLFASAYMAEVVRGGMQAIPKGQYEGADSIGLGYWQSMRLIILPQALKISIPNIVNTFIGLFKDTTLVAIVGIFDLVKTIESSRVDPNWAAPTINYTGYAFAGLFYFIFCWGMSRYSRAMENRLSAGQKR